MSSEHRVLGKSLALAAFLVVAYVLLVQAGKVPPGRGIDQQQANTVRLQRYLYDSTDQAANVLVGSSLAYNIRVERIDPTFDNLGIASGSSQTGLAIILASGKKPKRVFVEISEHIVRKEDQQAVRYLTNPRVAWLYRHVPASQQAYQPVNVALTVSKKRLLESAEPEPAPALRRSALEALVDKNDVPLAEDQRVQYLEQLDVLAGMAAELESRGTEVVLVRIPVDAVLEKSRRYGDLARWTRAMLPESKYEWLPEVGDHEWFSRDGMHLSRSEADYFASYMSEYSKNPTPNGLAAGKTTAR